MIRYSLLSVSTAKVRHSVRTCPRHVSSSPIIQRDRPVMAGANRAEGAYIGEVRIEQSQEGIFSGLSAVVKDCYSVAGHRTSNGNPRWLETHPPATTHAAAVQALLQAGARISGMTIMDDMAYALEGANSHYGTPTNPACPDRLPGGSSSGAAAAVGAGDADIGLGGDTGGSVRVPASYCGILGIRPTHGRALLQGSCPLAPSFDAGGWFARDASVLRKAGSVLLDPSMRRYLQLRRLLLGRDAFGMALPHTSHALRAVLRSPRWEAARKLLGEGEEVVVGGVEGGLESWTEIFRLHQGYEVWQTHGGWVTAHHPEFGPGVKQRFEMASRISQQEFEGAVVRRAAVRAHLEQLLGDDAVLVVPSAPSPAPLLTSTPEEMSRLRPRLLSLTCIAGLAGLPQVSLPLARVEGCPVGLGLIGPQGSDEALLELVELIMQP